MARRTSNRQLEMIAQAVQNNPDKRAGFIARKLGLHRSSVMRVLPALEEAGILLAEDDHGRLFYVGRQKS
ncbi:MAG: helix-turn-helix domain-containing protein [Anaerolineae bacterium]